MMMSWSWRRWTLINEPFRVCWNQFGCAIGLYFDEMYYPSDIREPLQACGYVSLLKHLERNQNYSCLTLIILAKIHVCIVTCVSLRLFFLES